VNYPRPQRTFVRAYEQHDTVSSLLMLRDVAGVEYKPLDYLKAFNQFVTENPDHIDAVKILLDRPRAWSPAALTELREKLARSRFRFSVENLQRAHESTYRKALVDVISMVKHAADQEAPLLTASERVERAFTKVTAGKTFTADEQKWLDRIREHLRENLSIDREDFEVVPVFADFGGWGGARKAFGEPKLDALLAEFNVAIAA
jgi:type I restriction enzyme R subunit